MEAQNRHFQKSESLTRMAGAIVHNYNNLLALVMGNLELAMTKLPPGAVPLKYLNETMKAVLRATELNSLMLTYLGETHNSLIPLDLSEVYRKNLSALTAHLPENVLLETDLPSPGPTVMADEKELRQILGNLLKNAAEAIGKNRGQIRLTVKTVSRSEISGEYLFPMDWKPQEDIYACLEISDSGCGIPKKDMEKIFDPFFSSKFTGRGLGLSVALGIARTLDGGMTAKSEVEQGSVFSVFLPLLKTTL